MLSCRCFFARLKLHTGNSVYGTVTLVLNPSYKDKIFVAPFDTGAYSNDQRSTPYGTIDDFFHLIGPHLAAYGYADLSTIFWRWYGGIAPPKINDYFYFEAEMSANLWIPEALLYLIGSYDVLWGTADGERLQAWLQAQQRPLVWGNGDSSGASISRTHANIRFLV